MTTNINRFSITLYGTKHCGFSYLLSNESGLVATNGAGSNYKTDTDTSVKLPSAALAVKAALAFVIDGSVVAVYAPGTGRVTKCGMARNGRIESFADQY